MPLQNYAPAASIRQDYGKTVADVVALRAVTITERFAGQLIFVDAKNTAYELEEASGSADDGDLIIKPTDEVGAARWEKRFTIAAAPAAHAIGGAEHTASTLATVNTKISDATLQISPGRVVRVPPTDDLTTLLGAASDGDSFIIEQGDHVITTIVVVTNARITLILARGAKISSVSTLAQLIQLSTGANDFQISGGELECGATVNSAIKITAGISRIKIQNVHFNKLGTTAAGPAIDVDPGAVTINDLNILDCFIDMDNFAHGIETSAAALSLSRWKIKGNSFISAAPQAGSNGIKIIPTGAGLLDSIIRENTIDEAAADGITISKATRCHFDENHVRNCGGDGIELAVTIESKAHGNHCSGNTGVGILESGASDFNLFDGNHLRANTGGAITVVGAGSVNQGTLS